MATAVQFPIILMALIETALAFQCNIPGQCINSLYIGALQVQHVNQCIEACRANQDCFWSSINPVFGTCNMYSDCNVIEDTNCLYCLTNEKSCTNIQCSIQGACMEEAFQIEYSLSHEYCSIFCQETRGCTWSTFDSDTRNCRLFDECPEIDEGMVNFTSSQKECQYELNEMVLLSSGYPEDQGQVSEIISISNPHLDCQFFDSIPWRYNSIGGLLGGQPIICGGYNGASAANDCVFVKGSLGEMTVKLKYKRTSATSIALNGTAIWVLGGADDKYDHLNSSEIVTTDSSFETISLPFTISNHCMVKVSENAIYVIGGWQNYTSSGETWMIDPVNGFSISKGPTMNKHRTDMSCGTMKIKGRTVIIVAGGDWDVDDPITTVEILDPTSDLGWLYGPKLPFPLTDTVMVSYPSGKGVALVSGYNTEEYHLSDAIIELSEDATEWKIMRQKVKYPREAHLVIPIPEELTSCH